MSEESRSGEAGSRPRPRRTKPLSARIRQAREQFEELAGVPVESVSGFEKTEDGWTATLEVLELRKVPDTVSLLATYKVDLDTGGDVVGYRRVERYTRGRSQYR